MLNSFGADFCRPSARDVEVQPEAISAVAARAERKAVVRIVAIPIFDRGICLACLEREAKRTKQDVTKTLGSLSFRAALNEPARQKQADNADSDEAIGDIEDVIEANIAEIDHIRDRPE